MNVITPEQSEQIGTEIFTQVFRLDDLAHGFGAPWGATAKERMRRLCRVRMKAAFPFEAMESEPCG
jgi:hypothetical protein